MAIDAAKSVSFGEKKNSVRFKISLQKVLKIKKIHIYVTHKLLSMCYIWSKLNCFKI